ncbi:hypothetical protein THAOC_11455 [Thalassiosira oceanica]|uniref:Uncharacterized protein n=1 Tax=Thalassiosira oceanica TaxID=159749 RepID=K0SQ67_THAOC|nr:hypothetical protein THAOC_11455 [Thalassiosira oceanica]|eukprot:EJK67500.1 hypothetical protein THAOC_11455 [Thalassiosira oceanica]
MLCGRRRSRRNCTAALIRQKYASLTETGTSWDMTESAAATTAALAEFKPFVFARYDDRLGDLQAPRAPVDHGTVPVQQG